MWWLRLLSSHNVLKFLSPNWCHHCHAGTSINFESPPYVCVDQPWPIVLHLAVKVNHDSSQPNHGHVIMRSISHASLSQLRPPINFHPVETQPSAAVKHNAGQQSKCKNEEAAQRQHVLKTACSLWDWYVGWNRYHGLEEEATIR